jgi:glycerol-3-phosphate dehydrogenase
MEADESRFDVAIIGAGDVGTAIARELAAFELRVALFEAGRDVGAGTSKANTAILHTGFDAKPGTIEARLVARGHQLLSQYAKEVGIPLEKTGALLVAWTPEEVDRLPEIEATARANGYDRIRPLSAAEIYKREPALGPRLLGGLELPDEHIVCPWTSPLACATQAVQAGVILHLEEPVTSLSHDEQGWTVRTPRRRAQAKWVINAAGLRSDEVHAMAGHDGFTITPRRGELIVFDKLARPLVRRIVLPVPTATSKGVLVAPTVFGNVMVGPTAVDIADKGDTQTTGDGLTRLRQRAAGLVPGLADYEITATYTGLRAASNQPDYQLGVDDSDSYAWAGGIRSTGLTAALAIAEELRDRLDRAGLELHPRRDGLPAIRMPNIGEAFPRPYAQPEGIDQDPAYGEIVCFCERVTAGEIRDATTSPIPPRDLDGLRRRTRVLMGRCQGFFCGAHVARALADERHVRIADIQDRPR